MEINSLTDEEIEVIKAHRYKKAAAESAAFITAANQNGLSWRDVMDCKKYYGHIDVFAKTAHQAGYRYFSFNGLIYVMDNSGECQFETGLEIEDVK
jgi:hypothetical protein